MPNQTESSMRMMGAVAVCGMLACAPAQADYVPPFKGNDTGGIIAYALATQTDARQLAVDHCAYYGKVVKFLGVDAQYGGYIFFLLRRGPLWARGRPAGPKYQNAGSEIRARPTPKTP